MDTTTHTPGSFELDNRGNLGKQVRKAASSQLDKAVKALRPRSDTTKSKDASVHTARKRLKEVRALLRLVRNGIGEKKFDRENRTLRDAARPLSEVRDATALIEALQSLQQRYNGTIDKNTFESARKALGQRRSKIRHRILVGGKALEATAVMVKKVRDRVDQWDLRDGAWKVLQSGLLRAYKRGSEAMAVAARDASDEHLHESRKRMKDLRYQLELLRRLRPEVMEGEAKRAETVTEMLGDDHDLAVLRGLLESELKETVTNETAETLKGLIDGRRADLQHSALSLGEQLFAESPEQFVERIKTYWKAVAAPIVIRNFSRTS